MSNTKIKAGQFSGIVGNGTDGYFLMTNGDGTMAWEPAGAPSPTVTSVTYPGDDTAADPAGGQSVTLTGTNFATGATVTIGGTTASTVSFVSATELTITTPAKAAGDYDIVVTNTDGGTATFVDGISYNGIPSWTTASGSLGTFASDTTISTITLQASEPDAGTITFNITSGALPTGLSLTGANIDGTTSKETADTLYNFTVTAIDDENQSTPRAFSITVEKYIVPAPENFEIVTYTGNGGTQAITSKIGKAASFNGSSSKIDASSVSGFPTGNSSRSISLWVYNQSTVTAGIIGYGNNATGQAFYLYLDAQGELGVYGYSYNYDSNYTLPTNQWVHLVVTHDGTTTRVYANGTEQFNLARTFNTGTDSFRIGGVQWNNSGEFFNGKIDQVRIFDKAISSSEVTTLYNETYASSTKSTTDIFGDGSGVALYELDEDANDTGTTPYGTGAIDSGQSAVFNGSSSYITIPINQLTNNFTFSAWLYLDDLSTSYRWIFGNWYSSTQDLYMVVKDTGEIEVNPDGNNGTVIFGSSGTFTLNTWHHFVVTMNAGTYTVYLNNVSLGTGSTTNTTFNNGNNYQLGKVPNSSINEWSGKIDQVRIYSSALSSSDVESLASETNVPTANLVAHYKLDGNANDETGSYNGTPTNITYSDPAEFPLIAYNGTPTNVNFLGMAFQPDLVWIKPRSFADNHVLSDSVRGVNKSLSSNTTSSENSLGITSFDSNGFSLPQWGNVTSNGNDFVAWCWKAGGSAVSNTDGTITSQVSANPDAGFSIVSYTGNGANATIGHGLGVAPSIYIIKNRDAAIDWAFETTSIDGSLDYLFLNSTAAKGDSVEAVPNETIFNIDGSIYLGANNNKYIAYCFHSVDGYQKIGSYTGTNATNAVTTGFEPRFLMVKLTSAIDGQWVMYDNTRSGSNPRTKKLAANSNIEENNSSSLGGDSAHQVNFTSTGFELLETSGGVNTNKLNETYIYLAIA